VPSAGAAPLVPPAHNLDALGRAGFDVLSLANNHILDGGREVMLENRRRLHAQGVATCGAGGGLEEARAPAILETGGVKIAFLAYASDHSDFYGVAPRKGWPLMPLHRGARMTALGYVRLAGGGPSEFGFVPCGLNPEGVVRAVDPETPEGREVVDYVEHGCSSQKLNGRVDRSGYVDLAGHRGARILPAEQEA